MESDKRPMGKASIRPNAKIIAAFLCLPLILASLAMVSTHLYAARMNPDQVIKWSRTSTMTVTVTTTATATPTNTPTPTPTETPTPTPTEVPTNTPTPEPTATATPTPAPTATTAATATPTAPATATAKVGATSTPTQAATAAPTQTTNPTQSPTALPWGPTSTTNGSGNGGEPTAQSGSSIGILSTFAPFIIGALIFTGVVGALLLALVLLRKRLMPLQPLSPKLPPSGAPPWRRTRIESLQGTPTPAVPSPASNAALAPNANSFPQPQPALFSSAPGGFPSQAAPFPGTSIGFPPPQPAIFPYNANAFPPGSPVNVSDQQFQGSSDPPTSGVLTANKPDRPGSSEPVTEQMKTIKKPGTRLVKLEKSETPPDR